MHIYVFMLGANAYILEYQLICKASSYVLDDITEIVPLESMIVSFNFNLHKAMSFLADHNHCTS